VAGDFVGRDLVVQRDGVQFGAQNHGALLLMNGILYIPSAAIRRRYVPQLIIAVDVTDPTRVGSWMTRSHGPGSGDPGSRVRRQSIVFGVTGDTTSQPHDQSDSRKSCASPGSLLYARHRQHLVPTQWQSWTGRPAI
jgi:hypothetical protein